MSASNGTGRLLGAALILAALVGCSAKSGPDTEAKPAEQHHEGDGHDHGDEKHSHIGPHGGHLIELGQEAYHAELVHDEKTHQVTIYLLDGQVKKSVAISQPELTVNMLVAGSPRQFKLAAVPQASDSPPSASCFQAENEELCDALCEPGAKGRLNVSIQGKHFVGEIEQHEHDADGHEHPHQADRGEHQAH
ncbi:MAG: hypothetical protein AB7O59_15040 [Pirellulales bacterium]